MDSPSQGTIPLPHDNDNGLEAELDEKIESLLLATALTYLIGALTGSVCTWALEVGVHLGI